MSRISIQVPENESETLTLLLEEFGISAPCGAVRPFDGVTMAQILIPVSAAIVSVLKKWIDARQKTRSAYRIFFKGTEITGYSAEEAERIIMALSEPAQEINDE